MVPHAPARPSAAPAERAEAWTGYWRSGALHSCAGSFAGNYGGEIRAFWLQVFSALPPGARVLDLCCGNAPLAKLLVDEGCLPAGATVDAVDAAAVAPAWLDALAPPLRGSLRVHAGVDAAALPFEQGGFDLCMSQYGIEYVGEAGMREAARVLRPGGRFAGVLHHVDSLPVRIAREELQHLDWLQQPGGLLQLATGLVEPFARSATAQGRASLSQDAAASARRGAFNACLQELERRAAGARYPDVLDDARAAALRLFGQARADGADAAAQAAQALLGELQALRLRQQELAGYALDEAALAALLRPLGDPQPQVALVHFGTGDLAGWAVRATRR